MQERIKTKGSTKEDSRRYYREYMKERRASLKSGGRCPMCGELLDQDLNAPRVTCRKCLERQKTAQIRYVAKCQSEEEQTVAGQIRRRLVIKERRKTV